MYKKFILFLIYILNSIIIIIYLHLVQVIVKKWTYSIISFSEKK